MCEQLGIGPSKHGNWILQQLPNRACLGKRRRAYELWSKLLNGGYVGAYIGEYYGAIKGDTRSLDNGTCGGGLSTRESSTMRILTIAVSRSPSYQIEALKSIGVLGFPKPKPQNPKGPSTSKTSFRKSHLRPEALFIVLLAHSRNSKALLNPKP